MVAHAVWKATSLQIKLEGGRQVVSELSARLTGVAGASGKLKATHDSSGTINYDHDDPIAFGIQVTGVQFEGGVPLLKGAPDLSPSWYGAASARKAHRRKNKMRTNRSTGCSSVRKMGAHSSHCDSDDSPHDHGGHPARGGLLGSGDSEAGLINLTCHLAWCSRRTHAMWRRVHSRKPSWT